MMKQIKSNQNQTLMDERARLVTEFEALRNKISGLDLAISLIAGQAEMQELTPPREMVTGIIRRILEDAGAAGLSTQSVADMAEASGLKLNRNSISSLLSRMKKNGEVVYRQRRYILHSQIET